MNPSRTTSMKHRLHVIASLALCAAGCRSIHDSTFDSEVALTNAYTFRGQVMNDGGGAQAEAGVNFGRGGGSVLRGEVSGYLDWSGDTGDGALEGPDERFSRIDLGASLEKTYTRYRFMGGIDNYNFPNVQATSTTEVFGGAERVDWWLRPRALVHYDIQNADDVYVRFGFHPHHEFDRALYADLGADVGYMGGGQAEFYYGVDESGFSDVLMTSRLTYVRDEHFRAFIGLDWTFLLSSDLEDQNDLNGFDDSSLIGFLGCGWAY
jgi:hypothetical protein